MHDIHRVGVFRDAVDHAVVTSASGMQATKLGTEGLAYRDIASDPLRPSSADRPELGAGVRVWHLSKSRDRVRE